MRCKLTIQPKVLEALAKKLRAIDGEGEINYSYTYEWSLEKITFGPRGMDTKIKADIMQEAGYKLDMVWEKEKERIRKKSGIRVSTDTQNRKLARLFNNTLRKELIKTRKACLILQKFQNRYCKKNQKVSDPVKLIIGDILPGFQQNLESELNSKEYD